MNFLFVDKILSLEPGKKTVGLKQVTASDEYLYYNHQGNLAINPSIIAEALGQLGSWNVIKTSDFNFRILGGVVEEINALEDVLVGDTILLETTIDSLDLEGKTVQFHGTAYVRENPVLQMKNCLVPLFPLEELNDIGKVKKEFLHLF